jgi:predicted N-acetyltransferase YhbS
MGDGVLHSIGELSRQGGFMSAQFLQNPDRSTLIQAAGDNQREWLVRMALASGGEVREHEEATWTYTPRPKEAATLAFPRFTEANAGEQIDRFLEFCRERRPIREIAVWTEGAGEPWDLGGRLVARGFNWGWQPHWMGLDFEGLALDVPSVEGVWLGEVTEDADWRHPELGENNKGLASFRYALTQQRPQKVWVLVAMIGKRVVGHCILNLTEGPLGVAGLYDMGVSGSVGRRGIGRALVFLACQTARDLGCRFAVLNSANDGFWLRLSFQSIGYGQTWWLREKSLRDETLRFERPSDEEIAFVEAVGRGDTAALESLGGRKTPEELNRPILGRFMTPMDLAVSMERPASVEWLVDHGAAPPQE